MIRGLMWYGLERGGIFILEIMVLNLGGLLDRILIKNSGGYIIESGILNFFLKVG